MPGYILPDLIDNDSPERTLARALTELLRDGYETDARIATGYFNVGGYSLVRDGLSQAHSVSVLLGREATASGKPSPVSTAAITDEIAGDLGDALGRGARRNIDEIRHFLTFLQRDSVAFRLYRRRFLHAKAYVLDRVPAFGTVAIVGSSNFTAAGLTSNTELNMAQKQSVVAREFLAWFERLWNDEKSIDYKPALVDLFTRATSLYSPYLIYMKSLWEAMADRLGGDLMPMESDKPSPIMLADFQHDGYAAAKQVLETYSGVLIADPVGFGKTYLALRLLDDYAYQLRQKALIVCPAQLRDVVWQRLLDDFRIPARIESQEAVSQSDFDVDRYADADIVVVDESHNFRNPNANRWDNLTRLLTAGKPKKLVLLTATPINTSPFDLYHQLRLITKGRDDYFAGVGIPGLIQYFRNAESDRDSLHDLLETIAIRRSRSFIRRNYPDAIIDGRKVHFPDRELHSVVYNLQRTYEGIYADAVDAIERLHFAPYLLEIYKGSVPRQVRLDFASEIDRYFGQVPQPNAMIIGRQVALVGIMKMLYLKRLESSVASFRISVKRAIRFQLGFLEQLRRGRILRSKDFHRIEVLLRAQEESDDLDSEPGVGGDASVEAQIEAIYAAMETVDALEYDIATIEAHVNGDVEALRSLEGRLDAVTEPDDDKLVALKRLLATELKGHKVLVFSYFRDTARYVFHALKRDVAFQAELGHTQIESVHGGASADDRADRIQRFSPQSNGRTDLEGTPREIQLLISTDVLSEGQNLQDADVVVNFDLHWNPVRMVQRAGRIDRIGSRHQRIGLYNFIPEDALESLIAIVRRLRDRLDSINKAGLLDAPVMGEVPTPQDFNALKRLAAEDQTVLQDLDSISDLDTGELLRQELLDFLKKVGEARLRDILPFAGSGKRAHGGKRGLYVHLRAGAQHFQLFYDLQTEKWEQRRLEALKLARCAESEPIVEPDFDIFPIVDGAKKHVANYLRRAALKVPNLVPPQNHVVLWLKSRDAARFSAAETLVAYFAAPLPAPQLKRLKRLWNARSPDPRATIDALQIFARDNPRQHSERPEIADLREDDLQVVCYMALV